MRRLPYLQAESENFFQLPSPTGATFPNFTAPSDTEQHRMPDDQNSNDASFIPPQQHPEVSHLNIPSKL